MLNQNQLCEAIRKSVTIMIRYDADMMEREFAPYIVYVSSKNNETLAGYQIRNPAEPFENGEWRNMTTAKIRTVRLTEKTFRPDASFNPSDKRYSKRIICHVKQNIRQI